MKYRVVRDGILQLVPAAELVPDDIIIVQGGEIVPADAHILEYVGLTVDESRFTGDNTPVQSMTVQTRRRPDLRKAVYMQVQECLTALR